MKRSQRQANFELLRIIAMLMVVTLHYLNYSGALPELGGSFGHVNLLAVCLESLSIVAVNVYVMISGYFLAEAGFRIRRLVNIIAQVLFYSIGIPLMLAGVGTLQQPGEGGFYRLLQYVLPVQTEHYWFATSYVVLILFSPFLNAALKAMSKKQLQLALAGLFLVFSMMKSIVPVHLAFDRFGYDFGWFLCVYLLGGYFRLYGCRFFPSAKRSWLIYGGCTAASILVVTGSWLVYGKTGALEYYFTVPYHYNYILCLAGAAALFQAFSFIRIREGRAARAISSVAALTFGVYLFHENVEIRTKWVELLRDFAGLRERFGEAAFLPELLFCVLLLFLIGIAVDAIRLTIFRYAGKLLANSRLGRYMKKLDETYPDEIKEQKEKQAAKVNNKKTGNREK